jgi:hypothetical protein
MVQRARDRLIVTAAMMQRLHDKLQAGRLQPVQAEAASSLILAQLEQTLSLLEDAGSSLWGAQVLPAAAPIRVRSASVEAGVAAVAL